MRRIPLQLALALALCAACCSSDDLERVRGQRPPDSPLLRAAWQGDVQALSRPAPAPSALDEKDSDDKTALHWAAAFGRDQAAAWLLDRGADPSARSRHDVTPLHLAAIRGHATTCGLLLRRGARVSARDVAGHTPLHWAANAEVVDQLAEHGANVKAIDSRGMTPLHLARNKAVAQALIKRGARLSARARRGRTAWEMSQWDVMEPLGLSVTLAAPAVRLRGHSGSAELLLRHVGPYEMQNIHLSASSPAATVDLWPRGLRRLLPGQLAVVKLRLTRKPGLAAGEHALDFAVKISGVETAQIAMVLDTRPGQTPADRGEIRLGEARVRPAASPVRYLAYAAGPLALVVIWALLRRRRYFRLRPRRRVRRARAGRGRTTNTRE